MKSNKWVWSLEEQELEACAQYREKELQIKEEYKTYEEDETARRASNRMR